MTTSSPLAFFGVPYAFRSFCVLDGRRPDIILADYQLDDNRNGLDAMDSIREHLGSDIPGILITGYMAPEVRDDAGNRGYQVLYKPVKPAALRALVNKLLKQKRS